MAAFSSSVNYSWPRGVRGVHRHSTAAANYNSSGLPKLLLSGGNWKVIGVRGNVHVWACAYTHGGLVFNGISPYYFLSGLKVFAFGEEYWHNDDGNLVQVENENNRSIFLTPPCPPPLHFYSYPQATLLFFQLCFLWAHICAGVSFVLVRVFIFPPININELS